MKYQMRLGRPITGHMRFRHQFMSGYLKAKDFGREWAELSDEEKERRYVEPYEAEIKVYNTQMEEYRAGDMYATNKRKKVVLRARIKKIEQVMNRPKLLAHEPFRLFCFEKKETLKGKGLASAQQMWKALSEGESMEYRARWGKLKTDWQRHVGEWEEQNADKPEMTELKAYKIMLDAAKKL